MHTHRLAPALACPVCRTRLDAALDAVHPPAAPAPGDVTICAHCATVLELVAGPALERMTPAALAALPVRFRAEVLARAAVAAWLGPYARAA
jgi:hypothetical protein